MRSRGVLGLQRRGRSERGSKRREEKVLGGVGYWSSGPQGRRPNAVAGPKGMDGWRLWMVSMVGDVIGGRTEWARVKSTGSE